MTTGRGCVLLLCLLAGTAEAELARVMSVDSALALTLVDDAGRRQTVQLQGLVSPAEADALRAARKRLSDEVLTKLVRYQLTAAGEARLWIGAREINADAIAPPAATLQPAPASLSAVALDPLSEPELEAQRRDIPPLADAAAPVIADRQEGVYHRADCPGYSRVAARQRSGFASEHAAQLQGYRRAGNCPSR